MTNHEYFDNLFLTDNSQSLWFCELWQTLTHVYFVSSNNNVNPVNLDLSKIYSLVYFAYTV